MPPIDELRPEDPSRLGDHEIRGRLGEGGQGVVYLGEGPEGDKAAVKWLRPQLAGDPVAADRFAKEAAAAQRVAPFCTAAVLATGVHDGRPYIVSEYVEGASLRQSVAEKGPHGDLALYRLAVGTATALAAIHRAGIVHRDFSPSNVLLDAEGPRVIDFGIARALDATATLTTSPVGTPAFMAPEIVLGHPAGPAADLFAWASTMVFAATGVSPFAAETVPAAIHRVLYAEADLSRLTGPLRGLVGACLAKDPALRPTAEQVILGLLARPASSPPDLGHAAAVATGNRPLPAPARPPASPQHQGGWHQPDPGHRPAAHQLTAHQPVVHQPVVLQPDGRWAGQPGYGPPPMTAGRSRGRRRRLIMGLAAGFTALVALAVVGVVLANTSGRRGTAPSAQAGGAVPATGQKQVPLTDLPGAVVHENPSDPVRLTAYSVLDSVKDEWVVYTRAALNGPFQTYRDRYESMLSPDGRHMAGRSMDYTHDDYDSVDVTDLATGRQVTVRTVKDPEVAEIVGWSRDSRRILLEVGVVDKKDEWQPRGFGVVDVGVGKATIAKADTKDLGDVFFGFDPTGEQVVAVAPDAGLLRVYHPSGTQVTEIPNVGKGNGAGLYSPSGHRFATTCPPPTEDTQCVFNLTGGAIDRVEKPCKAPPTWYDDKHLACWAQRPTGSRRNAYEVFDFKGRTVRVLADIPQGPDNVELHFTR
ncbi:serine/threonine-protein kinase [Nonomuraea longicatena]|uniref:Protein kinase domain-containing protein n=1 Tax=Nonomuraea longicatena TaxID=83682 RepID=A0ABN1R3G5_9ACTN